VRQIPDDIRKTAQELAVDMGAIGGADFLARALLAERQRWASLVTERDLLRQAVVRYCDHSRMGTVEPMSVQQAIDDAFANFPPTSAAPQPVETKGERG